MDLVDPYALGLLADVLTLGAAKYGDRNWEEGMAWGRVYAAALRHLNAFWAGEECDAEDGLPHLAHALTEVMFLLRYSVDGRYKRYDNRPKRAEHNHAPRPAQWFAGAQPVTQAELDRLRKGESAERLGLLLPG